MIKKYVSAIALLVLGLMMAGNVQAAQADTGETQQACPAVYSADEGVWVEGVYCDGRLNAFDVDQPFAIYYARQAQRVFDDRGNAYITDAIVGIEFWTINSDGQGQLAMWVPLEQVEAAFGSASTVEIASQNGVTFSYSPPTETFVAALGSYTFTWKVW